MLDSFRSAGHSRGMTVGIVLGLVVLLLGGLSGCDRDRTAAVRKLNEGLKAYERGETSRAVELLEEATKKDADYAKPHYQAAQLYEIDLDGPKEAERHYRQALDIKPDNARYSYGLARVLSAQSDHQEAVEVYQKTVQNDPSHAKAWFRMGLSQRALGDNAGAVDSFTKAIKASPRMKMDREDTGGAHYHALGDLYVEFGFFDKALKVYENGITNNPNATRLFQGRGVAQLRLERYSDAAQSFEKALEIEPSNSTALFNLAVAHEAMGHPKGAMDALKRFLQVAGRGNNQARIAAAQGMMQKLKKQIKQAE